MGEYIDRDAFLEHMKRTDRYFYVKYDVENFPTADVAPVVHGRWEYVPQTLDTLAQVRCSNCDWWTLNPAVDEAYNYCPNCGAKMEGSTTVE